MKFIQNLQILLPNTIAIPFYSLFSKSTNITNGTQNQKNEKTIASVASTMEWKKNIEKNTIIVNLKDLIHVMFFLKTHSLSKFEQLTDIIVVDSPTNGKNRFEITYSLLSTKFNDRLFVKVYSSTNISSDFKDSIMPSVPSLMDLFPNANWLEREAYDMFGIFFENHKDLRRILTDYGFTGFPLRKDFPLIGYNEVRYDEIQKRVISEKIEISQESRLSLNQK